MENLVIKGERDIFFIPNVHLNAITGECLISGESYLEETVEFYRPVIEWLEQFMEEENQPITFNFKLTYFNTSSSRSLVDILHLLKEYEESGGTITINWYYNKFDIDKEEIEDFIEETGVNINLLHTENVFDYEDY